MAEFSRFESSAALAEAAAARISAAARRAIAARGRFRLVLAGGRTPLAVYARLQDQCWDRWELFLGDERCLPPGDPERNSQAIAKVLTERVAFAPANVHWIPAELGAEVAAARYAERVRASLPFDLVVLGMGEDGHTASLFPGQEVPGDRLVAAVHQAPKPPPDRVTLTPRALAAAPERLILVTGTGKQQALAAWRKGADLPVVRVAALGPTAVFTDVDADPGADARTDRGVKADADTDAKGS